MSESGTSTEPQDAPEEQDPGDASAPGWWHRSHPTFAALVGFFAGVAYVIVVPGLYAAVLGLVFSDATAAKLFPLVGVALLVPLVMLIFRKTRRFAQMMFIGIVSTAVVIVVTGTLTFWIMTKVSG
jgi:heme/copper-type cytochrome/quinol oxidase subunit 4